MFLSISKKIGDLTFGITYVHGNESFDTYTNAAPSLPNDSNFGLAYFFSTISEVGYIVKYTKQYSVHKVNTGSHH